MRCFYRTRPVGVVDCRSAPPGLMMSVYHISRTLMRFHRPTEGLYDPRFEHDACGVSFVADMRGRKSHRIVELGLSALCNLDHRGALGADTGTGDGAGILLQVPDRFFREVVDFELPPPGQYATGIAFLPQDPHEARQAISQVEKIVKSEGLDVIGWREVPTDPSVL